MRLAPEVLLEIVSIFQDAMMNGTDASQRLRELDLVEHESSIILSQEYVEKYPRATVWPDQDVEEV